MLGLINEVLIAGRERDEVDERVLVRRRESREQSHRARNREASAKVKKAKVRLR